MKRKISVNKVPAIGKKKIKHAKEEKDKTYEPGDEELETSEEDEEEEEEEIEENENEQNGENSFDSDDAESIDDEEEVSNKTKSLSEQVKDINKKRKSKTISEAPEGSKKIKKNSEVSGKTTLSEKIEKKVKKKEDAVKRKEFNDKNVDFNFHNESPDNIVIKRVKLSSNVILGCKMIEAQPDKQGLSYDYAALTFQRKTRNNSVFEFNLPLTIVPQLMKGCQYIMDANKMFFSLN